VWHPPVLQTIASRGDGVSELYEAVERHRAFLAGSGLLEEHRRSNVEGTIRSIVESELHRRIWDSGSVERLNGLVIEVLEGRKTPRQASGEILSTIGKG
jgi:LAO/AO transport system kinase